MIEEYQEVLAEHPPLLQRIVSADFIITVNTARGHFDRAEYQGVKVLTPGAFVNLPAVQKLVQKHFGAV